jgi:hypothetical protein
VNWRESVLANLSEVCLKVWRALVSWADKAVKFLPRARMKQKTVKTVEMPVIFIAMEG